MPIPVIDKFVPASDQGVADAQDINVDASGFDGNLDSTVTSTQLLAQAVDDLDGVDVVTITGTITISNANVGVYANNVIKFTGTSNSQVAVVQSTAFRVGDKLTISNETPTEGVILDFNPEIPVGNESFLRLQKDEAVIVQFTGDRWAVIGSNSQNVLGDISASDVSVDSTNLVGVISSSDTVQTALERLDATGLGTEPKTFTGSFFSNYGENGNQGTWYGGLQSNTVIGESGQSNGNYTFELPSFSEVALMFDDLASKGVGEVFTLTIGYLGGSTSSVVRNSLTIRPASVSNGFDRNELPVTIAQGASVTLRIERVNGVVSPWERLSVQQATDPVATFGEVVIQSTSWNNANSSFLPSSAQVQKGYAFPVFGSNPNDGTLRQGLLDAGVSDRLIYDGDYVVWTADAFTSWVNGDDWFVLNRDSLQRMSREESNFLSQVTEVDNRVILGAINAMSAEGVVWLSENPLAEAPFITPSSDSNNPRNGDDYAYIGGRENRDSSGLNFQFGQNRFNSFMTIGISPNFANAHEARDILINIRDIDGNILDGFNLEDDFTFIDDSTFTNSTYRHYQRSTSINYPFLATIEVVLSQVQEHFTLNPNTVNVIQNIPTASLQENQLSQSVQEKLNRALPTPDTDFSSIEERLSPYRNDSTVEPAQDARYLSATTTDSYPSSISSFTQVLPENPRFTATDVVLFIAVEANGNFLLTNVTTNSGTPLDDSFPTVEAVESLSVDGITYFIYRVTGITSGHVFEVDRATLTRVVAWQEDIDDLKSSVTELEAEAIDLPDNVRSVLENETSVTEQTTPVLVASDFNKSLGNGGTQKVYEESSPHQPSSGVLNSEVINKNAGARARRKLIFIGQGHQYANSDLLHAYDGNVTNTTLLDYAQGDIRAKVFVPAQPAGSTTTTIYPAPSNRVSGNGIWQTIPTLTFSNGIPIAEADELFFTRNMPTNSTTLDVQYRGHANGNLFGAGTATLAGVGGSSEVSTSFTISDGSESATIEVRYYPNFNNGGRAIRVSVTERVNSGLPTINDVQVILSFDETRAVPATSATVRNVTIESQATSGHSNAIAIKPSSTGTVILVGSDREVDTGYDYTTVFGATEGGNLVLFSDDGVFYDYENFEPTDATMLSIENHTDLPNFGMFDTTYNHETTLELDVTIEAPRLNLNNLPTSATGLVSGDIWNDAGTLKIIT